MPKIAAGYPYNITGNAYSKQIFASSLGSIIATLALNPINVIKVKMQMDNQTRKGVMSVVRSIVQENGMRGFLAGSSTGLLITVPNTIIYILSYEKLKEILRDKANSTEMLSSYTSYTHMWTPVIAGGIARFVSTTVMSPLELVRTMQIGAPMNIGAQQQPSTTTDSKYSSSNSSGSSSSSGSSGKVRFTAHTGFKTESAVSLIVRLFRSGGVAGLYKGWLPTILRDCPFSAIYWGSFEVLRPVVTSALIRLEERRPDLNISKSPLFTFLSASAAGLVATVLTQPYDVLKTMRQLENFEALNLGRNKPAATTTATTTTSTATTTASGHKRSHISLASVWRAGRWSGLFRGLSMRLATVIPSTAIMVTVYTTTKNS